MSFIRLPFTSAGWTTGTHPLERKKLVGVPSVALIEFAPGFEDPNWCERGHVIYVLGGTLELALDDRAERLPAGDGCVIAPNTRHRARNPGGEPVRLLVMSPEHSMFLASGSPGS